MTKILSQPSVDQDADEDAYIARVSNGGLPGRRKIVGAILFKAKLLSKRRLRTAIGKGLA